VCIGCQQVDGQLAAQNFDLGRDAVHKLTIGRQSPVYIHHKMLQGVVTPPGHNELNHFIFA
jgi:hypothetical protein